MTVVAGRCLGVFGGIKDTEREGILPGNLAVLALSSLRSIGFASSPFGEFAFFLRDWLRQANPGYFIYSILTPTDIVFPYARGWNDEDVL
jgi:hypothetical protein